jgi:PilZ domain
MSPLTEFLTAQDRSPAERRFYPRVAPLTPIPLSFGDQTAGTILNLSENGILVSTSVALEPNSVHRVSLQLDGTDSRSSLYVHTVWSAPYWQKSGLQFLELAENDRAALRAWSARQLNASSQPAAPVPAAQISLSATPAELKSNAPVRLTSAPGGSSSQTAPLVQYAAAPARGRWLSALRHHRRAPVRYFWTSFAATVFLGATWAAVEVLQPDKVLKAPVVRLRSARRASDSLPSATPSAGALAKADSTVPVVPRSPNAGSDDSAISNDLPHQAAAEKPVAPQRRDGSSFEPMRSETARPQPPPKKPATVPQLRAWVSAPAKPVTPSAPPNGSAPVTSNSDPPLLNPQPISPNSGPTVLPHTERTMRQPVPTPQPATPPAVAPNAPLPSRVAPPPVYSRQILEIPSPTTSSYVQLPGEHVVRLPYLTMHIQRSVWVKASHWFWHSRKRVDLGEITTRVDPQLPRFAPGYATPQYASITVLATIARNGQISSVRPLYGPAQLLPSVSTALHNWRYQPTFIDHQPVQTLARIEVDFRCPDPNSR